MYCVESIRCEGVVYIRCNANGDIIHFQDGVTGLDKKYAEYRSRGGVWRDTVTLDLIQNDPRYHDVPDVQTLVGPIVLPEPHFFEIKGDTRRKQFGIKCEGPQAQSWHFQGICPTPVVEL